MTNKPTSTASDEEWEADMPTTQDEEVLLVDLDGFEGPLDLLLALCRAKKIDLAKLSIAELATQYIHYIENLKKHRFEIAADYLVMAAWLVFLKSKLLLPKAEEAGDEPSGSLLAAQLAFRLKRLDAMRQKGKELMALPQLDQEFFTNGMPQGISVVVQPTYKAELYELLKAYAGQRERQNQQHGYKVKKREVWSIKKARDRLSAMLGISIEWAPINDLIALFLQGEDMQKTTVASTFGATLEMARDGLIELRQSGHFTPLYVKTLDAGNDQPKERGQKPANDRMEGRGDD